MPIIFFVSGAAFQLSFKGSYWKTVLTRLWGMLIPYWIYGAICILLSLWNMWIYAQDDISCHAILEMSLSWLIPSDGQTTRFSYLTWALWYVPIYLNCVVLSPILWWGKHHEKTMPIVLVFALYLASYLLQWDYLMKTCFYLIWMYLGMFYPDIKRMYIRRRQTYYFAAIGLLMTGIAGMLFCHYIMDMGWNMQNNKFPPNLMFLFYSAAAVGCFASFAKQLLHIWKKLKMIPCIELIVNRFSKYSLTVFLFHPLSFLGAKICSGALPDNLPDGMLLFYYFITGIMGTFCLTYIFGWIQKIRMVSLK